MSYQTGKAHTGQIKLFIIFHNKWRPNEIGVMEMRYLLVHLVWGLALDNLENFLAKSKTEETEASLANLSPIVQYTACSFLLSRINGDAPPASDVVAAALWIVREQASLNL
jgi:hypothetical protein